jgi:Transposase domain (DUF772)
VTLGRQLRRPELPTVGARWWEAALPGGSVYRFLARERARLFPPELFADLFQPIGRRSVPPSILAVVMVLQRLEGLSDREAADRFCFDVCWRYAAGVADAVAGEETASFAHGAGRSAGPAAPLPGSRSDLPSDLRIGPPGGAGRGQGGAGLGALGGCGRHPGHRDHAAGRSGGCCGPAHPSWPPRSGVCSSARMTMLRRASRPVTGPIARPGRRWSTPGPGCLSGPLRLSWGAAG